MLEKKQSAVEFVRDKKRVCFVTDAKGNKMINRERIGKCPFHLLACREAVRYLSETCFLGEREAVELS